MPDSDKCGSKRIPGGDHLHNKTENVLMEADEEMCVYSI